MTQDAFAFLEPDGRDLPMQRAAVVSVDGVYRYELSRVWDNTKPTLGIIGLNPSLADGERDDNTVRKWRRFSVLHGFGGFIVGNLFALRSPYPTALVSHADPVGPDNNEHLAAMAARVDQWLCCWGVYVKPEWRSRAGDVIGTFFSRPRINLLALKVNADGSPAHPLYLPYSLRMQPWSIDA